jgi:alginate O-acetyltransferase complex protein AlgI
MLFCSEQFLLFFAAVFAVYWSLHYRWARVLTFVAAAAFLTYNWSAWTKELPSAETFSPATISRWFSDQYIPLGTFKPEDAAKETDQTAAALSGVGAWCWVAFIFCGTVLAAYRFGHDRARVLLLLASSFFFYASWNRWLALLICVTTLMDYFVALGCDRFASNMARRTLLILSLVVNLGLLAYMKYSDFFLRSILEAIGTYHFQRYEHVLRIILPVGISFYTFEAINYTIDVYRRRIKAETNLLNFMVFITFFPHLIAGPIVRARDFLPQVHRRKHFDWPRMQLGVQFFLMGLFKKLAIADRMALFSDPVFKEPGLYNSGAVWLATLAYAVQIYCDFSGYTDMALGTAHMLGYKLAQNFNMPYSALNVSDFWRRWHISLSSWLRDYLFIPLGGSRGTNWQINRNLMMTMALGGLWHGASWTFVVWGVLHGSYLIIHRYFKAFCETRPRLELALQTPLGMVFRMALTFASVCFGWIFFRAQSFTDASTILNRLIVPFHDALGAPLHNRSLWYLVGFVVICHAIGRSGVWKKWSPRVPAPVLGFGYATCLTLALVLAVSGKTFIYFQF